MSYHEDFGLFYLTDQFHQRWEEGDITFIERGVQAGLTFGALRNPWGHDSKAMILGFTSPI